MDVLPLQSYLLSFCFPFVEQCMPSDQRDVDLRVAHHVTTSSTLNQSSSYLSTSLFLKKVKNSFLPLFFTPLVCIHLAYLRKDRTDRADEHRSVELS